MILQVKILGVFACIIHNFRWLCRNKGIFAFIIIYMVIDNYKDEKVKRKSRGETFLIHRLEVI